MQRQQIRLMSILAVGLGLLVLAIERPWPGGESKDGKLLYPDFSPEKISRVQVINRQDTVNLVKRDPIWLVQNTATFPADSAQVRRALEAVGRFRTSHLMSKNTSKFSVFEVDTTGASIQLFTGSEKPEIEFLLGKTTPDGGTYFRPVGKDQVYSSPDRVRSLFVRNARAWQDRKVTNMETTEAARLIVEHGDSTIVFEKGAEGRWSLTRPDSFAVKPEEMEALLQGACKLVANAFPDSAVTLAEAGLAGKPKLRVRAERLDGSGVEVLVGTVQDPAGLYYAKAADREWIYKIGHYRLDPYYKDLATFKAEPAPASPAPPGAAIPGAAAPGTAPAAGDARPPG